MRNAFSIDWTKSRQNIISHDRDDLPPNIVSFEAVTLTASVLKKAVGMVTGVVQIVQIEVPYNPFMVAQADGITMDDDQIALSRYDIQAGQRLSTILGLGGAYNLFQSRTDGMVRAVIENFGIQALHESFMICSSLADVSQRDYYFHTHVYDSVSVEGSEKAFYLTQTFGEKSTAFLDIRDLDIEKAHADDAMDCVFKESVRQPELWMAKPGAILLFTTKGHEHGAGPAYHATPPCQSKARKVAIVDFKIP